MNIGFTRCAFVERSVGPVSCVQWC